MTRPKAWDENVGTQGLSLRRRDAVVYLSLLLVVNVLLALLREQIDGMESVTSWSSAWQIAYMGLLVTGIWNFITRKLWWWFSVFLVMVVLGEGIGWAFGVGLPNGTDNPLVLYWFFIALPSKVVTFTIFALAARGEYRIRRSERWRP